MAKGVHSSDRVGALAGRARRALRFAVGMPVEVWRYARRDVEVHRQEVAASEERMQRSRLTPTLADGVQAIDEGVGSAFHRSYVARVRGATMAPDALLATLERDFGAAAPSGMVEIEEQVGRRFEVGDDVLIHLAGPWDAPVRVIEVDEARFRFATRGGHMEAGEIEFRVDEVAESPETLDLVIESWARSGDRGFAALYHPLGLAKEVQLHMWVTVLERLAQRSGGELVDGIEVTTRRRDDA